MVERPRPFTPERLAERRRGPARFRERDVKAAIRAVRATGEHIASVEIGVDGRIRVIVTLEGIEGEAKNPWDED